MATTYNNSSIAYDATYKEYDGIALTVWTNKSKHTASWSNQSKDTSSWTNKTKNTASWTNQQKSDVI